MNRFDEDSVIAVPEALGVEAGSVAEFLNDRFELGRVPLQDWVLRWEWLARSANSLPRLVDDPADAFVTGLFARVWLDEAMMVAGPVLSWWLVQTVEEIDETFRTNTVPDHDEVLWGDTRNPRWWWLRRMPVDAELAARLRSASAARKQQSERSVVQSAFTVMETGEPVEVYQIEDELWVRVSDVTGRRFAWFQSERCDPVGGALDSLLDAVQAAASGESQMLHEPVSVEGWSFWRGIPAPIRAVAADPMRKSRRPEPMTVEELRRTFMPTESEPRSG